MGLIFAEFATSLKSPKIDTAKNKPYFTSLLRLVEIAKIGLSENFTHLPIVVFTRISRREKFRIYGIWQMIQFMPAIHKEIEYLLLPSLYMIDILKGRQIL